MSHIAIQNYDTIQELNIKLKKHTDEAYKTRIKAMILAKKGLKRLEIVDRLTVDAKSVTTWLSKYNEGGTVALVSKKGGRPKGDTKWGHDIFEDLIQEIDKGGYWSIPRMQDWLTKNKKLCIPEQTVWYRMNELNYSYKSARPHPVQGNKDKQNVFKKGGSHRAWSL